MRTRNEVLSALLAEYQQQQAKNRRMEDERLAAACAACPEIGATQTQKRQLFQNGIQRALAGQPVTAALTDQMEALNRHVRVLLSQNGFPEDYLQPIYRCPVCHDTGYMANNGDMCACLKTKYYEDYGREMGLRERDRQTFETFDAAVFSDAVVPEAGTSQRKIAQLIRKKCEQYADAFPHTETDNLLLYGQSGLGKTFLLHAVAHRVIERGYSVLILSAYRMMELMRSSHREGSTEGMRPLMEAELLLIDDLGTEPLMENITIVQLFNLLNERLVRGLHTVLCTNLTPVELKERYTERVTSRLLDRKTTLPLYFVGTDIRVASLRARP